MKLKIVILLWALALLSCQKKSETPKKLFDVDSLIDTQVAWLTSRHASLTKVASVNDSSDKSAFVPDSSGWANELEVFRHLDIINKAIYEDAYNIMDGQKDDNSNLTIQTFQARRLIPVKTFKVYYQDNPKKVRKIEAILSEENALYYTSRKFLLELDDYKNQMILSKYFVRGVQKMILRDSVEFSISSRVTY